MSPFAMVDEGFRLVNKLLQAGPALTRRPFSALFLYSRHARASIARRTLRAPSLLAPCPRVVGTSVRLYRCRGTK